MTETQGDQCRRQVSRPNTAAFKRKAEGKWDSNPVGLFNAVGQRRWAGPVSWVLSSPWACCWADSQSCVLWIGVWATGSQQLLKAITASSKLLLSVKHFEQAQTSVWADVTKWLKKFPLILVEHVWTPISVTFIGQCKVGKLLLLLMPFFSCSFWWRLTTTTY